MAKGGNGKGNGGKSAPVLDDLTLEFESSSTLDFKYAAFDSDKNEKLTYAFIVNGAASLNYTAPDGASFTINPLTGHIVSSALFVSDQAADYVLNVQVIDKFRLTDVGTLTISLPPACTEFSLDLGQALSDPPELINAGADAFCFTSVVGETTIVDIDSFSSDDKIVFSGISTLNDLSFSTGTGADGVDDLLISWSNGSTFELLVLRDVITVPGFVFDYNSAVAAVQYDFAAIA